MYTSIKSTDTTTGTTAGTATGSTAASGTSTGVNGAATLGGTDFLTLMLAQLKNQDPTSPVDSNTFLTQLAQLSQVQGINTLNNSFNTLSSSMASSTTSSQAMQASSLLGHQALVASKTATLATSGAAVAGSVAVPQTTSSVIVNVANSNGVVVRTLYLGAQAVGNAAFSWDGKLADGSQAAAGTYTLSAAYAGQTKTSTAATTAVSGTVESVSMGAGGSGLTLNVAGVGSVPFSSLQQVSN